MSLESQKPKRRNRVEEPRSIQARVRYRLSEQGRRESLRQGGDGRALQEVQCVVPDADLDAFTVTEGGSVGLDLAEVYEPVWGPVFEVPADKARWIMIGDEDAQTLEWDVVPSCEDLVATARNMKAAEAQVASVNAGLENQKKQIGDEFFADPNARATVIEKDYVVVGGHRFKKFHAVGLEARDRWRADQEAIKKANTATLMEWIQQHGTENQRQRLAAGLLPWKEAYEEAEESFFAALAEFNRYARFEPQEVCRCMNPDMETCEVKFQSVDASELTAEEWEQFAKIKATVPNAQFQVREHRAQCVSTTEPVVKRGVIVKFTLGNLTFKREFAV